MIMDIFFTIVLIGISLSMDAFSLALVYGTYSLVKKDILLLSVIVGLFHFFMPLMGLLFGSVVSQYFIFNISLVVGVIFGIIGIEMIISSIKEESINVMVSIFGFLLFGLSVSIDSFTTGIGLSLVSSSYIVSSIIFMFISAFFTYMGLIFGSKISYKFGKYATFSGGIIMLILSFSYIF